MSFLIDFIFIIYNYLYNNSILIYFYSKNYIILITIKKKFPYFFSNKIKDNTQQNLNNYNNNNLKTGNIHIP